MPPGSKQYTIGVEEEYQIVDPETRELLSQGERVIELARRSVDEEEVAAELLESQVETVTPVCHTLADVRAEVLRLRCGSSRLRRRRATVSSPRARTRSHTGGSR